MRCRTSFVTPLNLVLVSALVFVVYTRFFAPRKLPTLPPGPKPILFRTFIPTTLLPYNGTKGMPIYFAVRGRVFDVSTGANFYGPDGPYANFAGRDATRGLACHSFDEDMLTEDLEGPLDDLKGLGPDEMESLANWEEQFLGKYLVVGKLVAKGDPEAPKE